MNKLIFCLKIKILIFIISYFFIKLIMAIINNFIKCILIDYILI